MSYKDVLRVFKLERELTDDETATLNTLRAMTPADMEATVETFGGTMGKASSKSSSTKQRKIEHCTATITTHGINEVCGLTKRARVHKDSSVEGFHVFQSTPQSSSKPKSARASSIADRLPKPSGQGVQADEYGGSAGDTDMQRCAYVSEDGDDPTTCGELVDANLHHKRTDPDYHPFVPAASSADESSSPTSESSKGGQSSTPGSEVETDAALGVTGD